MYSSIASAVGLEHANQDARRGWATSLHAAFTADHTLLKHGFARILDSLAEDDLATAVRMAHHLDRALGPHIEFEEEMLYPLVASKLGHTYAARLYAEHQLGRDALMRLMQHQDGDDLDRGEQNRIIAAAQIMLDHALACDTLLHRLGILIPATERQALARILELRDARRRWSELPTAPR